jgi:hypothetical protein
MRRLTRDLSLAALAFALVVPAYARTNVPGIPLECRTEVYQVALDGSEPKKLDTFEMYGAWSFGAYSMSYDRKNVFFERFHGVALKRADQPSVEYDASHMTSRYILWSPDSKKAVMSMSNGTVLIDVGSLDPKGGPVMPPTTGCTWLYKAPKLTVAYGGCWSPDGRGYFVLEADASPNPVPGSKIKLYPPSGGGSGREIINHASRIGYFMTPNSWFQDGSGPSSRPYNIVFGAGDGFFISDSEGKVQEKLDGVPADGLDDIEFSPAETKDKEVPAIFATCSRHVGKVDFRGIHLVKPNKLGQGKAPGIEALDSALDVHTLLFSPKGKYIAFANKHWVKYREVGGAASSLVTVEVKGSSKSGLPDRSETLEVNGFAWDLEDKQLAIAAGNGIYLHDPVKKTTKLVVAVGDRNKTFTAEPDWRNGEIIFTAYNDIGAPFKR